MVLDGSNLVKKLVPVLGLLACAAMPALAEPSVTADPSKVEGGTYKIEPNHAQVLFKVVHFGFTDYYGELNDIAGTLKLDPKEVATSSVEIRAATASVTTKSEKLAQELKGNQWLDAAKYPDITFRSTGVSKLGPDGAKIAGELTIHGVTKPVTLDTKFIGAGPNPLSKAYTVGFEATGRIKRSDFGVKTYLPVIGDEVDLIISAPFEKQG